LTTTETGRLGTRPEEAIKAPVVAVTTANIILSGEQTIDGISVVAGDRVLVKDQTDTTEQGIYDCSTGAWSRSTDFNGSTDLISGNLIADANVANNGRLYQVNFSGDYEPGITVLAFTLSASSDIAIAAAASAASAAADAALTAADVITTNADVVTTNADVVSTNADVVSTSGDASQTAADRVVTTQDAIDTAADVVTVEGLYDSFDDRYLGAKASAPTLDNDGDALLDGALYWNTTAPQMWVWDDGGSTWGLMGSTQNSAGSVNIADAGGYYTGGNVEAALQEVGNSASATLENKDINGGSIHLQASQDVSTTTEYNVTGIPSWVKRITITLDKIVINGIGDFHLTMGDSGGLELTGYDVKKCQLKYSGAVLNTEDTTRLFIGSISGASDELSGTMTLRLHDAITNTWIAEGLTMLESTSTSDSQFTVTGIKSLTGTLDRMQITPQGSNTMTSGKITVSWE